MQISVSAVIFTVLLAGSLGILTSAVENGQCDVEDLVRCNGADDNSSAKLAETLLTESGQKGAKMLLKKMEEECEAEEKEKDKEKLFLKCLRSIDKSIEDYHNLRSLWDGGRNKRKSKDLIESEEDENTSAEEDKDTETSKHESGEEEEEEKKDNEAESLQSNNANDEENSDEDSQSKSDKIIESDESSSSDSNDEIESLNQNSKVDKFDTSSNEKEVDSIQNEEETKQLSGNDESTAEEKSDSENDEPGDETSSDETKEEIDSKNKNLKGSLGIEPDAEVIDYLRNKRGYNIGLVYYNPWLSNKFKYILQPYNVMRS